MRSFVEGLLMDTTDFVSLFCTKLADQVHKLRQMRTWYVLGDKRPGTVTENFNRDAADFAAYRKLFQP